MAVCRQATLNRGRLFYWKINFGYLTSVIDNALTLEYILTMPILQPKARLIASAGKGRYPILAIAVGAWHESKRGPTGNRIYSTEESLRSSVSVFDGVPVAAYELKSGFRDHLPDSILAAIEEHGISFLKNRVGRLSGARFGEANNGEKGIIVDFEVSDPVIDEIMGFALQGGQDFDGFSIDAPAEGGVVWSVETVDGVQYDVPTIKKLRTLDMVKNPAAGGKVLRLAASFTQEDFQMNLTAKQIAILSGLLKAAGVSNEVLEKIWADNADVLKESVAALREALKDKAEPLKSFEAAIAKIEKGEELDAQFAALDKLSGELVKTVQDEATADAEKAKAEADAKAKSEAEKTKASASNDPTVKQAEELVKQVAAQEKKIEAMQTEAGEARIEAEVTASHLPDVAKKQLTERLKASRTYESAKIKAELDKEAKYLAAMLKDAAIPGMRLAGSISIGADETDQLIYATRAMLIGNDPVRRAALQKEAGKIPVVGFRSLREFNSRVTGSRFDEPMDRVFLKLSQLTAKLNESKLRSEWTDERTGRLLGAVVTQSDLASVYLVAMHNQMLADYQAPSQYDTWRLIAKIVDLKDLYAHAFTRTGWYQAAASVAEGGTYQETTTTPSDENISLTAVKYGQIMSITEEMVINDKLGAFQRLQLNFSDGVKRDIYTDVMDVIRTNVAVAYGADTNTLIHSSHSNGAASGGADLTDSALIEAGWGAMVAQAEFGTTHILGDLNKPRYLLTHVLRNARAIQLTQSERAIQTATTSGEYGSGDLLPDSGALNSMKSKGIEPIIMLNATTAANWWLLADPNVTPAPAVVVGFLNGRDMPEIVTEPANTGSNFTADKIRLKSKHRRDVEPGDHRGIYGQLA